MRQAFKLKVVCCREQQVGDDCDKAPSLVGPANETYVRINGQDALALLDSGSQVSCISRKFYDSHLAHLEIKGLDSLIQIEGIGGAMLPYTGYVEVELTLPGKVLGDLNSMMALLLVTDDTRYNDHCPVLLGTNIICRCLELHEDFVHEQLPMAWKVAFQSVVVQSRESSVSIPVKVLEAVEIPAMSSMVVDGLHCGLQCKSSTPVLVEATFDCSVPGGLLVTPAIYNKDAIVDSIPISIVNTSEKAVTIPSNCLLCYAIPVQVCSMMSSSAEVVPSAKVKEAFPLENLSDSQRDQVYQCIERHVQAFSWSDWDLGHCSLNLHRIHLKDDKPFRERYRRIPPAMVNEVREHLQNMMDAKVIQPSSSPYASPALFVRKPDQSLRFVIDYRRLNSLTIRDSHYLPRIDDTFDRLAGSSWFSTLDLKAGYWQLDMHPDDRHLTAFTAGCLGFYEWIRLPMGLSNSAACFQRVMESVMGSLNLQSCLLYLDDIIIFSDSWENHLLRLDMVLTRLEEAGLKLKPSKCCLFQPKIKYLGHILSEQGISTDPTKIERVRNWPIPTDHKQLHRFLAFCGYYRRFIKNFSEIASPLQKLLRGVLNDDRTGVKRTKGKKSRVVYPTFEWGMDQQSAFDVLKTAMTSTPVLAYADFTKPFLLQVDASGRGLGAVLNQQQDGKLHPIAFASRGLTPTEQRYPAHKLEFLAMKWAISEKFHDYLYGNSFEVITDNNPLTYVLTSAKLDATGLRWVAALSSYNFGIRYKPGKLNTAADALSRLSTDDYVELSDEDVKALCSGTGKDELVSVVAMSTQVIPTTSTASTTKSPDWSKLQREDPVIGLIRNVLEKKEVFCSDNHEARQLWRHRKQLFFENDILYKSCKLPSGMVRQLVLPTSSRNDVLRALHDDMGHFGRDRVLDLVRSRFFWPSMKDDISRYISGCQNCLKRKKIHPIAELVTIETSSPMELVSMDFLGLEPSTGGYNNILVLTDHFTRYAMAIPTRNQLASTTAKALIDLFVNHYGMPQRLHSDKGANFIGKVISEMCKMLGIRRSTTTPYHPMGNGQCERFNQTLLQMLGTLPDTKKSRWKEYVQPLVHAYNCTRNDATGYSPFELMFGRTPRLPVDDTFGLVGNSTELSHVEFVEDLRQRLEESYRLARANIGKHQDSAKKYYDRKVRGNSIRVGDKVLVKKTSFQEGKHKLANRWEDQVYEVVMQLDNLPVFEIVPEDGKGKRKRMHRNNLLPIASVTESTQPDEDSTSDEEEVQDRPQVLVPNAPNVSVHPQETTSSLSETTTTAPEPPPAVQDATVTEGPARSASSEEDMEESEQDVTDPPEPIVRRSTRSRKLPVRFQSGDFVLSQRGQVSREDKFKLLSKLLDLFD